MKHLNAIFLALLTLGMGLRFSVNTHWCQGQMAASSFSMGLQNTSCGMQEEATCDFSEDAKGTASHQVQSACCDETHSQLNIDQIQIQEKQDPVSPLFILPEITSGFRPLLTSTGKGLIQSVRCNSPPLQRSFQVLYQIYRI